MVPLWFVPPSRAKTSNADMRQSARPQISTMPSSGQARGPAPSHRPPHPHSGFLRNGPPSVQGRQFPSVMPPPARPMAPAPGQGRVPPHQMPSNMPQQMQTYNKQRFPPSIGAHFPPEGLPHPANMMRRTPFPPMHRQMHPHPQGMHPQMRHPGASMPPHHGTMPGLMSGPQSRPAGPPMMNRQMQMRSIPSMLHGPMRSRAHGANMTMSAHMGQHPGPGPLRESRAHNVQVQTLSMNQKPQESEVNVKLLPAEPVPVPQTEATLDAASILLGLRTTGSPTPSLETEKRDDSPQREAEMIRDGIMPTRLALPDDENKLNSMHCFLRSELLELFVVEPKAMSTKAERPKVKDYVVGSSCGRVGLRCIHCAQARKLHGSDGEAPMAVFYPKSISELYRLVTSWQRVHLRKCRNLPPTVRDTFSELKNNDKSRGKTQYWVTSARELGLIDSSSKAGGIRFAPE